MASATPQSNDPAAAVAELQSRLQDLELSKSHNDTTATLQKERTEMLLSLRKIMAAMKAEAASGSGSSGTGGSVSGSSVATKELEQLRAENLELKKVNAKQEYRIQHLVYNLRESLEKQ